MLDIIGDGRYQLFGQLGAGGMGTVYDALDTRTGRRRAIKVISVDNPRRRRDALRRFVVEARALAALDSPHIAKIYDVETDSATGVPFLVLERLEGRDMQRLLDDESALNPDAAVRLTAQAAAGLAAAHRQGVVHRDIKPANLFLCHRADGRVIVKLLDFGVAKARRELVGTENIGLTSTDHILGTPRYMSPEQVLGMKTIDPRADVWSLGTLLFVALTGSAPFHDADTLGKLVLSICSAPVPSVQDAAPWVSPRIVEVVHRALRRPPEERFQTADEMRQALLACVASGTDELRIEELSGVTLEARTMVMPRASLNADAPFLSERQIAALVERQGGGDPALTTINSLPPTAREGAAELVALSQREDASTSVSAAVSDARPPSPGRRLRWLLAATASLSAIAAGIMAVADRSEPAKTLATTVATAVASSNTVEIPDEPPLPSASPASAVGAAPIAADPPPVARVVVAPRPAPIVSSSPAQPARPGTASAGCVGNNALYIGPDGHKKLKPECGGH
jgi:serine/threonine-protein kinase